MITEAQVLQMAALPDNTQVQMSMSDFDGPISLQSGEWYISVSDDETEVFNHFQNNLEAGWTAKDLADWLLNQDLVGGHIEIYDHWNPWAYIVVDCEFSPPETPPKLVFIVEED
jgi:hypothetical protein